MQNYLGVGSLLSAGTVLGAGTAPSLIVPVLFISSPD
jgi:hypothetical protein